MPVGSGWPLARWAVKVSPSAASAVLKWLAVLSVTALPSATLALPSAVDDTPGSVTVSVKFWLALWPWASVAVTTMALAPNAASWATPEITPVAASMLMPVGSGWPLARWAVKVRWSPLSALASAKWLPVSMDTARPSATPLSPMLPDTTGACSSTVTLTVSVVVPP